MPYYTPLRYPGGKGKLAPFIEQVFLHNNLSGGTYIEPYSGGAAVALHLLFRGVANHIIINDFDYEIYAFWKTVLTHTDWLCHTIENTPVNMDVWFAQKEINKNFYNYSLQEVGFSTFFLNRTNRSGIIKGGVIGGKNQDGPYKIDARYNKKDLINRIINISTLRDKITLYNMDALELVQSIQTEALGKVLFYFDPPYFKKGKMLYKNSYQPDDHKKVSDFIYQLKYPWIVTYDNDDTIHHFYQWSSSLHIKINYSAYRNAVKGEEVLFYGNVSLPEFT